VAIPISLQRIRVDGTVTRNHFIRFNELTHTSYEGEASLDYRVNRIVSGRVGVAGERKLTDFEYLSGGTRNLERITQPFFTIRSDTGARLYLQAEQRGYHLRNARNELRPFDYDAQISYAGAAYDLPSGGVARAGIRRTTYNFRGGTVVPIEEFADDSRQTDVEVAVDWRYSGKTKVIARLAHSQRAVSGAESRETQHFTGGLDIQYRVTPITTVRAAFEKAIAGPDVRFSRSAMLYRSQLELLWAPRPFATGQLFYHSQRRDYETLIGPGDRDDTTRRYGARFNYRWKVGSNAEVSLVRETRDAALRTDGYSATIGTIRYTLLVSPKL
jgi:hypothetical protein